MVILTVLLSPFPIECFSNQLRLGRSIRKLFLTFAAAAENGKPVEWIDYKNYYK